MTARQAIEAGQLLMSKRDHFLSLLLAVYYNYYGPDRYYTILSQGGVGAGDKDTFLHAARALGNNFYVVSEPVLDLGHPAPDGGILGAAMAQADPMQDYALTSQGIWRIKDFSVARPPRPFFIHANRPKLNPGNGLFGEKTQGLDGRPGRMWTLSQDLLERFEFDAEKAFWEEIVTVACDLERAFSSWQWQRGICESVQEHWNATFGNPAMEKPRFTKES